jgi:hypothetical protein
VTDFDNQDLQESPSASNNIIINDMDDNAEEDEQPRVLSLPTASGASLKDNERKNKTFVFATSESISDASPFFECHVWIKSFI